MNNHCHIKPKKTLRNWLRESNNQAATILAAFDAECEELGCECDYQEYLQNGILLMNVRTHQVFKGELEIKLPPNIFKLLEYLMRNKGRCVTYSEILTNIWGIAYQDRYSYIRVAISDLRIAIDDKERFFIKTRSHIGLIMEDHQK